jgi:peptide/nickel transport system substrate-binding protein
LGRERVRGKVSRVDPRAGRVIDTISVGNEPASVAVGAGAVWVANRQDGTVSRIDPATARVKAAIQVGDGPNSVAAIRDAVWVSNEFAGTLSHIDPTQDRVVETIKIGNRAQGVAATADAVYVTVRAFSLAHRGGTLIISTDDSASLGSPDDWQELILTNDGLTAFRRVGGARLVPDLATSLPTPTDGGKTYTFQLRRGIRYSNGALVRPADFRRAIARALLNQSGMYGGFYFNGIVGAAACLKTPKRCDLSKGIVTDTANNTVTFHLTVPDPDLLYQLALPPAFAVPSGIPLRANIRLPPPARTWSRTRTQRAGRCSSGTHSSTSGRRPHNQAATRTRSSGSSLPHLKRKFVLLSGERPT